MSQTGKSSLGKINNELWFKDVGEISAQLIKFIFSFKNCYKMSEIQGIKSILGVHSYLLLTKWKPWKIQTLHGGTKLEDSP